MGLFRALADAIYKEYDRRIKRASLVTEYGISHHHDSDHADASHEAAAEAHLAEAHAEEDEAEIVNVPRGTPVAAHAPAPSEPAETRDT